MRFYPQGKTSVFINLLQPLCGRAFVSHVVNHSVFVQNSGNRFILAIYRYFGYALPDPSNEVIKSHKYDPISCAVHEIMHNMFDFYKLL